MSTTTDYGVTGMTCDHCVRAVTTELAAVPGVHGVKVELNAGGTSVVRVRSADPLAEDDVRSAVEEAGYTLGGTAP